MTCPDCTTAAAREHHGFAEGCPGCRARGIGRLKLFAEAQAGNIRWTYRCLLRDAGVNHFDVQRARAADALTRDATHTGQPGAEGAAPGVGPAREAQALDSLHRGTARR